MSYIQPLKSISYILGAIFASVVLIVVWFFGYTQVCAVVGEYLGWVYLTQNTVYQCLGANLVRMILLFAFLYCQLIIIRFAITHKKEILEPLNFYGTIKSARTLYKNLPISEYVVLIILSLTWVIYYGFFNLLLLWQSSHFLGDCDSNDLECTCNNLIYLLPFMLLMLLLSVLYISSLYIASHKSKPLN